MTKAETMSIYTQYPDLTDEIFVSSYDFAKSWTVMNPGGAFSELDVAVALLRTEGNLSQVARLLMRSRRSISNFISRTRDLLDLHEDIENVFLDDIEFQLREQAKGGDNGTIKFFLKTKGKNRGYNERAELSGPDGGPLELEVSPRELLADRISGLAAALGSDQGAVGTE